MQITPTHVHFCHGIWTLNSVVQHVSRNNDQTYILTEATPFHPVSHIWPDHPADRGTLTVNGKTYAVENCLVGAVELASHTLYVDKAIPVKRDESGWVFVVVHCLTDSSVDIEVGMNIELSVDKEYQLALSRGHSAGHLAYLALNKVLVDQGYWRKSADRQDPHGNADFNSYAQVTSFVTEDKCVDTYRLGKTLRKRGLNSADMLSDLTGISSLVNQQLTQWLQLGSEVKVSCHGTALTDSRYWQCDLQEGQIAEIPCGGTHVSSLLEYQNIEMTLIAVDEQNIEMHTHVNRA